MKTLGRGFAALALAVGSGLAIGPASGLASAQNASPTIVIDGDVSEWPQGVYAVATDRHVAIRFQLEAPVSLGAAPMSVKVVADLDGDNGTGMDHLGMGADVEITFSDPSSRGRWGPETVIEFLTADGRREKISGRELGLVFAPTHASDWFEMRFERKPAVFGSAKDVESPVFKYRVIAGGRQPRDPAVGLISLPMSARPKPFSPADATIPPKPDGALRVLSWNVLWTAPQESPEPFARVLRALRPDIVLFQEWDRDDISDTSVSAWLNEHASEQGVWNAETNGAWGVAVATPHTITHRGPSDVLADGTRWDYPIRVASAAIDTPVGSFVVGSVHTKCCGSLGTDEDHRRAVEAEAINDTLQALAAQAGTDRVILAGDFNLVGASSVLPVATAALDTDGSCLTPAAATVLGDGGATYTYVGRPDRGDVPSRLDYINYPDATMDVANAFVLRIDTLSDASLAASGLTLEDAWASDHLPVVVDLVEKK
ncbi:MAG: hypothetical protein CMJ31_13265 [Phycisphaerae bacterium]|nr:hypothetical protein [Phycisphaerae bacterium]